MRDDCLATRLLDRACASDTVAPLTHTVLVAAVERGLGFVKRFSTIAPDQEVLVLSSGPKIQELAWQQCPC